MTQNLTGYPLPLRIIGACWTLLSSNHFVAWIFASPWLFVWPHICIYAASDLSSASSDIPGASGWMQLPLIWPLVLLLGLSSGSVLYWWVWSHDPTHPIPSIGWSESRAVIVNHLHLLISLFSDNQRPAHLKAHQRLRWWAMGLLTAHLYFSLPLCVCMHMFMCVHLSVFMCDTCVYVHVEAWHQSGVFLNHSKPAFWDRVSHWSWGSLPI